MVGIKTSNGLLCLFFALGMLLAEASSGLATPFGNGVLISTMNALPQLSVVSVTSGQVELLLNAEAGVPHIVASSVDLVNWMSATTNSDNATNWPITLSAPADACFYRVSRSPIPMFAYALAANGNIDLNGLGIITTSWNSHDASQSLDGHYDGYAGTNGDIAVAGYASIGNNIVNGDVYLGPGSFISYSSGGGITGQIYSDSYLLFPDVALPTKDTNGNPISWTPAPGSSSSHTFSSSGYYLITDNGGITVQPGLIVTLDVRQTSFYPSGLDIQGGTTNAGTVIMYQESGSMNLVGNSGGGAINSRPENFAYFGLDGVMQITMTGTSTFVGVVCAPQANMNLNSVGGGINFIGSCVVSNVTVNGHVTFHYDTSLRTNGPCR